MRCTVGGSRSRQTQHRQCGWPRLALPLRRAEHRKIAGQAQLWTGRVHVHEATRVTPAGGQHLDKLPFRGTYSKRVVSRPVCHLTKASHAQGVSLALLVPTESQVLQGDLPGWSLRSAAARHRALAAVPRRQWWHC